jgi:hypothetical protein
VRHRRRARDQRHRRRPLEQPGQRDLLRRGAQRGGHLVELRRLDRREPTEREVPDERDALGRAQVDQRVVLPPGHVVEVLHGHHRRDRLRLAQLALCDPAGPEMPDQALLAQRRERAEPGSETARSLALLGSLAATA